MNLLAVCLAITAGFGVAALMGGRLRPVARRLRVRQAARGRPSSFGVSANATRDIHTLAARVLGSEGAAHAWLQRPAMGLENRTPGEVLREPGGVETVRAYLTRIEYGVYT
ncbi:antitoxin Xre/MbcA/ParS toxin-binding domain-containing protein [Roseivivax sp. CAU 1761]